MNPTTSRVRTVENDEMRVRILDLLLERGDPARADAKTGNNLLQLVADLVDLPRSEITKVANMNGWPDRDRTTWSRDLLVDHLRPPAPADAHPVALQDQRLQPQPIEQVAPIARPTPPLQPRPSPPLATPRPPAHAPSGLKIHGFDVSVVTHEGLDTGDGIEVIETKPTAQLSSAAPPFEAAIVSLSLIQAHPSNVGRNLGDLRDLTASIARGGVRVPVVLERHGRQYRLRDGHRRVAAARLAKLTKVPAIVHAEELDDKEWLLESIDYNMRRKGYSVEDQRRVAGQLLALGVSHGGVASAFGLTSTKLRGLLEPDAAPKPKKAPSTISRRVLLDRVDEWRHRADELEYSPFGVRDLLVELEELLRG